MKVLTTNGLTKLIQLIKSTFIPNTDVETTTEMDIVTATAVSIDNTPTASSTNLVTSGGVYSAIPTVNNATLTITQGGVSKGTFTANASSDVTIALDAGGGGSATDVQINGTSITSSNVANIITESAYNASTNKIATMTDVPTDTSDLTNGAGFITSSALSGYQTTANLVTSVSSSSTDTQYPSAKCVYDIVGDIESTLNSIRGV